MTEPQEPEVGSRIRDLRNDRGLSLRALAQQCDLSINAISRIERNLSSPTLSSLHQLAMALGVSIVDFFEGNKHESAVMVRCGVRQRFKGRGLTMDSLGSGLAGQELEPFLVTIEPGAGDVNDLVMHGGFEFVYCLGGTVHYVIEAETYRLTPGDSLILDSSKAHSFQNRGDTPATIILVFQADDGRHVARKRHLEP